MRELLERFYVLVNFFKTDEEGQGLAEYALILVLIAIVCVAALVLLGENVSNVLNNVAANLGAH